MSEQPERPILRELPGIPRRPLDREHLRVLEENGAYELARIARTRLEEQERRARQPHRRFWRWLRGGVAV